MADRAPPLCTGCRHPIGEHYPDPRGEDWPCQHDECRCPDYVDPLARLVLVLVLAAGAFFWWAVLHG